MGFQNLNAAIFYMVNTVDIELQFEWKILRFAN